LGSLPRAKDKWVIAHGDLYLTVPQQITYQGNMRVILYKPACEAMAEGVENNFVAAVSDIIIKTA